MDYDKKGNCIHHPQIKLRKKKALRGWTILLNECPLCVEQKASAAAQNNNNNNNVGGENKGDNIEDEYSQMQNDIIRKLAMADTTNNDDSIPSEQAVEKEQAPNNMIDEEQIMGGVDPDDYCNVDEITDVGDIASSNTNIEDGTNDVGKEGEVNAAGEQQPGVCYSSSSTGSSGEHSSEVEHNKKDLSKVPPNTPQAPSPNIEETSTPTLQKKMSVKDKQAWLTGAFEKKTVTPEAQNYYGSNTSKRTPRSWEKKQYIPPPVNAGQIYNNTPNKDTEEEEPKSMSVKERQAWLKSQAFKKSPNSSPNNPRPVISSSARGGIGGSGGKMSVKERQAWLTNSAFKKKDDTDSTIQSLKNRNAPDVSQWGDSPLIEKAKEVGSVGGDDVPQDGDIEKVTQDVSEDDKGESQDMPSVPPEEEEENTDQQVVDEQAAEAVESPLPEEEDFRTTVEKLVRQGEC